MGDGENAKWMSEDLIIVCVYVCVCVCVFILDAQWWGSLSVEHTPLEEVGYSVVSHVDGGVR